MWKFIAVIAAIALFASGLVSAADPAPAAPEARQKQMEEMGAIRGRVTFKHEAMRKMFLVNDQGTRYNQLGELYTKTRTNTQLKINAENAKPTKEQAGADNTKPIRDQAAVDAWNAKIVKMDEIWNRTLSYAWTTYSTKRNEQYQIVWTYLNQVTQVCGYDDYWNRADMDLQILIAASAAVEARVDLAKARMNEIMGDINKAMDEAEPQFKE